MLHSSGDRERKKALSNVGSNNETHGDITKIGHFTKPRELTLISSYLDLDVASTSIRYECIEMFSLD